MSMSEFEKDLYGLEDESSHFSRREWEIPDDFSEEDIAFAQELESLFSPEKETIPPYFVQTLLESEDARFQTVEGGFEQKTCVHVFRRLKLRRRLFRSHHSSLRSIVHILPMRRHPVRALITACLLFMLMTILATGTSFASGIAFLLSGTHSGVVLVKGYPRVLNAPATSARHQAQSRKAPAPAQPNQIGLLEAQQQLHFPMHWPLFTPISYSLNGIYLYQSQNQNWADGPILELDFAYALPGVSPHGSGKIAISEFKPQGKVFQVVETGAAHPITIDPDEPDQAIYVDGQWVLTNQSSHGWVYGERSELIYESDGIIFWIEGDQRDGINQDVLQQIATSLTTVDLEQLRHLGGYGYRDFVTLSSDDSTWSFAGDAVYLESPDGTSLLLAGTDSASSNPNEPPLQPGMH